VRSAARGVLVLGLREQAIGLARHFGQPCRVSLRVVPTHDAYGLSDVQEKIEILARAAEALGDPDAATAFRAMIQRPPVVSDADWPHYLEARRTRNRQLDDRLDQFERYPRGLPDDPIPLLRRIMAQAREQNA
jgi:hypothetical protein